MHNKKTLGQRLGDAVDTLEEKYLVTLAILLLKHDPEEIGVALHFSSELLGGSTIFTAINDSQIGQQVALMRVRVLRTLRDLPIDTFPNWETCDCMGCDATRYARLVADKHEVTRVQMDKSRPLPWYDKAIEEQVQHMTPADA